MTTRWLQRDQTLSLQRVWLARLVFAFLAISFRSAGRSTTHKSVLSLKVTLGILPAVPVMMVEVYYNMITIYYKGSLLEYKHCSDRQGLCASSL